jgi:hypothetical protein
LSLYLITQWGCGIFNRGFGGKSIGRNYDF